MTEEYTITTRDNPWNPYTHYREWLAEDHRLGYNTVGMVDYYSTITDEMSEKMIEDELKRAIDEILDDFPLIYKKIYRNTAKNE